jgi:hypothetical protein
LLASHFLPLQRNVSGALVTKLSGNKNKYRGRLNVQQQNIQPGKSHRREWRALSTADQVQASNPDVDEECKRVLTPLGFSSEDAEKMLKKVFGWTHSSYWSEEREKEVPTAEAVAGVPRSCDP